MSYIAESQKWMLAGIDPEVFPYASFVTDKGWKGHKNVTAARRRLERSLATQGESCSIAGMVRAIKHGRTIMDLQWSEGKRVNTKHGPRILRTAAPTDAFWAAWRSNKDSMKRQGYSCGRDDRTGEWQVCLWEDCTQQVEAAVQQSRAADCDIDIPAPGGLHYLPYQRAGIAYALQRRATIIGDEMGLGKTIQAIGFVNWTPTIRRVLIVCPASLKLNWRNELQKWLTRPLSIGVVNASDYPDTDIVIVNYDVLERHIDRLRAVTWDVVILDECHYIKNPKAKRTQILTGDGKDPIKAHHYLLLTGTPITNRPAELFPLLQIADPTGLGRNFFSFAKKYCDAKHNGFGWDFSGASNLDDLQLRLRETCMVRRLKKDVLTELPAKQRQVIELPANGAIKAIKAEQKAAAKYEDILADLKAAVELARLNDDQEQYAEAVERLREGQSAAFDEMSQCRHDVALAKVPHVVEHLETVLGEGNPVVIFCHHKDVVQAIKEKYPDAGVITGDVKVEDRQRAVEDFQAGRTSLIIGTIGAMGVGLTLTAAHHVVFAELDWVPGNVSQAEDRCHRIGQTESVLVQHLVLEGSLDAHMVRVLIHKQEVIDAALDKDARIKNEPITFVETPAPKEPKAPVKEYSKEQRSMLIWALMQLASVCDGARSEDMAGFNKVDARIGKQLALQSDLSPRQAACAVKLVRRYRRQLPDGFSEQF